MITYTWEVTEIKVRDEGVHKNAVVQTYWKKIGTDEEGNVGVFAGATPFSALNVAPEDFVPLDQLTEQTVLKWIQDVVVDDYEEHVNDQIQQKIERDKAREVELPWAEKEEQNE